MKIDPKTLQDLELRNQQLSPKTQNPILSVDYGEKFCGLAFTPDGICVLPISVVKNKDLFQTILDITEEKQIKKIIFGLPLSSDNYENKICEQIRKFTKKLNDFDYKIYFQNERFTSQSTSTPKKNDRIDDLAAAKILEYFLEQDGSRKK